MRWTEQSQPASTSRDERHASQFGVPVGTSHTPIPAYKQEECFEELREKGWDPHLCPA